MQDKLSMLPKTNMHFDKEKQAWIPNNPGNKKTESMKEYVVLAYYPKTKQTIIFPEPKTKEEAEKLAKEVTLYVMPPIAFIAKMPYPKWKNDLTKE